MAAAVAVVIVHPSGAPIVWLHTSLLLSLHPMWNRSQYMSVFNLSLLNFYPFACLYVSGDRVFIVSCYLWSRPCSVV